MIEEFDKAVGENQFLDLKKENMLENFLRAAQQNESQVAQFLRDLITIKP